MTMRRPTPLTECLAWWKAALECPPDTTPQEPQAGWYKRKLVKGGVFVPARLWLDQWIDADTGELMADERLQCEVNREWADAEDQWTYLAANPISEAEFNYLTASIAWTRQNAPHEPMANVRKAVDWLKVPTPSFT